MLFHHLLLLGILVLQPVYSREKLRQRLLNPIQVVQFPQDACVVSQVTGVCLSGSECNARGGNIIGSCAKGFGSCCTIYVQDCESSNFQMNLTYIVNPGYPKTYTESSGICKYKLTKTSSDICQIRLDFIDGKISAPNTKGSCATSYFTSDPITGPAIPPICGHNDGYHVYMDAAAYYSDDSTFKVVIGESGLDWKVLVSQIECSSKSLPPAGCLQYFMGSEGQVKSFNFGTSVVDIGGGESLQNQHYTICIRHELDHCSIGWVQDQVATDSFKISKPATNYEANVGTLCYQDFVMIPGGSNGGRGLCDCGSPSASTGNTMPSCDNFCGGSLNCNNKAVSAASSEIISSKLPFVLGVNFNSAEPAASDNRGFYMHYRQYLC